MKDLRLAIAALGGTRIEISIGEGQGVFNIPLPLEPDDISRNIQIATPHSGVSNHSHPDLCERLQQIYPELLPAQYIGVGSETLSHSMELSPYLRVYLSIKRAKKSDFSLI